MAEIPLTVDAARRVMVDQTVVPLTVNEREILLLLARTPGKIYSPGEIYREIWKQPDLDVVYTVRVHISRLRKKLDAACPACNFVETVWGKGYIFRRSVEDGSSEPCRDIEDISRRNIG